MTQYVSNRTFNKFAGQPTPEQFKKLMAAGFKKNIVSAEEHEDGIGACAGVNFTKNGVWYTPRQALKEIGE
jgi:hypothetical protein